jgi:hypothetical protein
VLPAGAQWRADFQIGVLSSDEALRMEQKINQILRKR